MNLSDALELFEISDILKVNIEELKKRYKKLMIKYHPDNYKGDDSKAKDIVEAYNIVNSALKEIESYNNMMKATKSINITTVIPFEKLIDIYNGDKIEFNTDNEIIEINQSNLFKHNIFVIIDFSVTCNGLVERFNKIIPVEMMRLYKVECDVKVADLSPVDITLEVNGETKDITINYNSTTVPFKFDNDIKVNVTAKKTCVG